MQDRRNGGLERCWEGGFGTGDDADCRIVGMQDIRAQNRRDPGVQDRMDAEQDGSKTGGIPDWNDARHQGCRTEGTIKDGNVAGQEGSRTAGLWIRIRIRFPSWIRIRIQYENPEP